MALIELARLDIARAVEDSILENKSLQRDPLKEVRV
jgi:hypothetical protein